MQTSEFLGLNLPELTDGADIRDLTENFEILDAVIGGDVAAVSESVRADGLAAHLNAMSRNLGGARYHITVTADTGAIDGDLLISRFYNGVLQITFENNTGDTVGTTCDHGVTVKDNSARIELSNMWLVSTSVNLVFDIDNSTVFYYTKFRVYGETTTGTNVLLVHDGGRLIGIDGAVIKVQAKAATEAILVYNGGEIVSPAAIEAVIADRVLHVYSGGVVRVNGIARPDMFKVSAGGQLICKAQRIPMSNLMVVGTYPKLVELTDRTWWVYLSGDWAHTEIASIIPLAVKNGMIYGFVATGAIPNDANVYWLWPDNTLPGAGDDGMPSFVGSNAQSEGFVSVEELPTW